MDNKLLNDHIKEFLDYLRIKGKRPTTAKNYELYLSRFIAIVGNISPEELTARIIVEFQEKLKSQYPDISAVTRSYHSVAVRSLLNYLAKMGVKTIAPEAVELPKLQRKEAIYLSNEDVSKLLMAANPQDHSELRDRAILEMLVSTGCRVSELANIKVCDINLDQREIIIRNAKGGKTRPVFLNPEALKYLKLYLQSEMQKGSDFLFPSKNKSGSCITSRSVERLVDKYALRALGHSCKVHTLRHTMASSMLQKGADIRSVQEMLGHTSIVTTQMYTHITNTNLKKTFDRANSSFSTNKGIPEKNEFIVMSKESFYQLIGKMNGLLGEFKKLREAQEEMLKKIDNTI